MFLAGSDGIRLTGLEHRVSRVGVGLEDQVRDGAGKRGDRLTRVSGAASMVIQRCMGRKRSILRGDQSWVTREREERRSDAMSTDKGGATGNSHGSIRLTQHELSKVLSRGIQA